MKLKEVFDQLTHGELSQMCMGGAEEGQIVEANYPKVVNHINLALTALYKRFYLKEGRVVLAFVPGRSIYPVHSKYAISNAQSDEPIKYLLDSSQEFLDDILKIEAVETEAGFSIPMNDVLNPLSIMTTSPTVLRLPTSLVNQVVSLPEDYRTNTVTVVYRANHPKIDMTTPFNPESVELELPDSHLEALLLHVASRVNTPAGMVNEFNAGNNYARLYELACQQLEVANYQIDQSNSNTRLTQNGWV